jgi:peptidyl-prolyl cis-trans isomerase D
MLKFFKKMERTRNFLLILFSVILVASLIVFGALSGNQGPAGIANSSELAATVGSERITVADIYRQQEAGQRFGQQVPPPAESTVKQIIGQRQIRIEAARLGLTASDAEVARRVREIFKPTDGQPFNQAVYEQNAVRQAGSVTEFESSIRDSISEQKLIAYVTSGVSVSEAEVLKKFQRQNTKFNLSYVNVNSAEIAQNLKPGEDELKEFFEKNKKDYYISLPQKKIKYIYLSTSKVGEYLELTDKELTAEYEKLPEERKRAGLKVQEIVLRVAKPEFDGAVLEKANNIISGIKTGDATVTEEAFAKAAQGQSENPNTAGNGGRVSGLVKPAIDPSKQDDPYQRILNMKEGEVTEPLKFGTNYYILRRGESVAKPFEDAKKEIAAGVRQRRSYAATASLAEKVATELKKSQDVEATAEKFASESNSSAKEMIRTTDFVKPGDEVEFIGNSQDFERGIAGLEKTNDIGDKVPVQGGFAIPMLIDKQDPRDSTFEEAKVKVEEAYKATTAQAKLEETAKAIAENASSASGLSGAASAESFKALESKDFILGSPLGEGPNATTSEALEDAVFALKIGEVTKEPIKIGDKYLIVGVTGREDADTKDFDKERDQLTEQMLTQERGTVYRDFIGSLNKRFESEKKIRIYTEAIAKVDNFNRENLPQNPQPPQQGFPGGIPGGQQQIPPELLEQLKQQQQQQ